MTEARRLATRSKPLLSLASSARAVVAKMVRSVLVCQQAAGIGTEARVQLVIPTLPLLARRGVEGTSGLMA